MNITPMRLIRRIGSWLVDSLCLVLILSLVFLLFEKMMGWSLANWLLTIFILFILLLTKLIFQLNEGIFCLFNKYGLKKPYQFERSLTQWFKLKRAVFSLTAITILLILGILEAALRLYLDDLPVNLANHLGHGYHLTGSGIYRYDEERKTPRMRKGYEREMYFNDFRWWHKTDAMGYRNPEDRDQADIILLGDSIIYGHGLEEEATVSSQMENLTQVPVVNFGQQGAGIHCEYQILKHDGVLMRPKQVFLFFLNNDINDLILNLDETDRHNFLKIPIGDHSTRYFEVEERRKRILSNWEDALKEFYVIKSGQFFIDSLTKNKRVSLYPEKGSELSIESTTRTEAKANPHNPGPFEGEKDEIPGNYQSNDDPYLEVGWGSLPLFADNPNLHQAMKFHLRALLQIKDLAKRHEFKFVLIYIYTGLPYDDTFSGILNTFCEKNKIQFLNLKAVFAEAEARGEQLFLPHDGHFTGNGALVTAESLADHFSLPSGYEINDEN